MVGSLRTFTENINQTSTLMTQTMLCSLILILISLAALKFGVESLNGPASGHRSRTQAGRGVLMGIMFGLCSYYASSVVAEELNPTKAQAQQPEIIRQVVSYSIPNLTVIRQDGEKVGFNTAIDDGRPVVMSFIFTSCAAICPMLSHSLMKTQSALEQQHQNTHLVSISIDPENDTPSALKDYAKKFSAGQNWDFYTGSRKENIELQKAFNVFRGDKMNHASVILIRYKPGAPWIRLEGFITSSMIIDELNKASVAGP